MWLQKIHFGLITSNLDSGKFSHPNLMHFKEDLILLKLLKISIISCFEKSVFHFDLMEKKQVLQCVWLGIEDSSLLPLKK